MRNQFLLLGILGWACFLPAASVQEKKTPDVFGFKVGEKMPFHVVDFFAGAKKMGGGCPSVMISNGDAR